MRQIISLCLAEMERYPIKQWETKYYDCTTKTWVSGTLRLKESSIDFSATGSTDYIYVCRYRNIVDVRKASSMLFFKALVVRCTSNEDRWFSSLASRDYVFNLIEHFWRNCLVAPSSLQTRSTNGTSLGQELLRITADSQKTLGQASETLSCQGEQLSHATALMVDLHDDLDVADPIIRSLDSWLGRWSVPTRREPVEVIERTTAPVIREFPVLFSEGSSDLCVTQGYVQISRDGLTILDSSHVSAGHLTGRHISDIKVTTPWQVVVTGVKLGEPDRSYLLMSAQMPVALQTLERFYRHKLQFEDPPPDVSTHTQPEGTHTSVSRLFNCFLIHIQPGLN